VTTTETLKEDALEDLPAWGTKERNKNKEDRTHKETKQCQSISVSQVRVRQNHGVMAFKYTLPPLPWMKHPPLAAAGIL
jgi:hypothetical protein